MVAAERINKEVERQVLEDNAHIVLMALPDRYDPYSTKPTCCDYFANKVEFADLLSTYIDMILQNHRAIRRAERNYDLFPTVCGSLFPKSDEWIRRNVLNSDSFHCTRYKLKKIWPCWKCMLKYNPTKKSKFLGKEF